MILSGFLARTLSRVENFPVVQRVDLSVVPAAANAPVVASLVVPLALGEELEGLRFDNLHVVYHIPEYSLETGWGGEATPIQPSLGAVDPGHEHLQINIVITRLILGLLGADALHKRM